MRRPVRALAIAVLAWAAALFLPSPAASAHPLGNFTVNVYAGVRLETAGVRVDYVVDMAEIPTFQELGRIDGNGDGSVSAQERERWAAAAARDLADGLEVSFDGNPVRLAARSARMELLPGQGGLQVLRMEAVFTGPSPARGTLEVLDRNYAERLGWREITISGAGRRLISSTVPTQSASRRLTVYPDDLLSSPLRVTHARAGFVPGPSLPGGNAPVAPAGTEARTTPGEGVFASLVARVDLSPMAVAVSVLAALGLGALHALAPGHGKAMMAGYLLGAGGRLRQAAGAAAAVAAMHTASVVGLGLLVLSAERAFAPERVYPWLGLLSGTVALVLGAVLLVMRIRRAPHGHEHAHGQTRLLTRRGMMALALSGGILPSPTAVVVLLGAVALGRAGFGLVLIVAFGAGLAASLLAVGAVAIRAGDLLTKRLSMGLTRGLPLAGASVIVLAGVALTARAALQLV